MDKKRLIDAMKRLKIVIIILAIIGAGLHLYLMYDAASKLEIKDKDIEGIDYNGGTEYRVRFTLTLNNPTSTPLVVKKITYHVKVEGVYVGDGQKEDLSIPPGTKDQEFVFVFDASSIPGLLTKIAGKHVVSVYVSGKVTVPVKAFGMIEYTSLTLPYEKSQDVRVNNVGGW